MRSVISIRHTVPKHIDNVSTQDTAKNECTHRKRVLSRNERAFGSRRFFSFTYHPNAPVNISMSLGTMKEEIYATTAKMAMDRSTIHILASSEVL